LTIKLGFRGGFVAFILRRTLRRLSMAGCLFNDGGSLYCYF